MKKEDYLPLPLGKVVATPPCLQQVPQVELTAALLRHMQGDWGDVDEEDKNTNDQALIHGARILSAYKSSKDVVFWIITEWDRSVTTFLLPDDY